MTLQSHPSMMAGGLNPSGVNPYSTPIPHYTPSPSGSAAAASNHAPSPPPFGHLGESQESSSSPKLFSREALRDGGGPYVSTGRPGHRYSSFQHHHPAGPTYPPPPVPTSAPPSSSRFSHFQSLGPSLVQAEAALWGEQQRRVGNGGADPADKKSRGERFSLFSPACDILLCYSMASISLFHVDFFSVSKAIRFR